MNGDNQKNSRNRFNGSRPSVTTSSPYTNTNQNTEHNRRSAPPIATGQPPHPSFHKPTNENMNMSIHQTPSQGSQLVRSLILPNQQDQGSNMYPMFQQDMSSSMRGIFFYSNYMMQNPNIICQQHPQIQQYQQVKQFAHPMSNQSIRQTKPQTPYTAYTRPHSNSYPYPQFSQHNLPQQFISHPPQPYHQQQHNPQIIPHQPPQYMPQNYLMDPLLMQQHHPNYHPVDQHHMPPNLAYSCQKIITQTPITPQTQQDYPKSYYANNNPGLVQPSEPDKPKNHRVQIIHPETLQEIIIEKTSSSDNVIENQSFQHQATGANCSSISTTSVIATTVATTTITTIVNVSSSDTSRSTTTTTTKLTTALNNVDKSVVKISSATINTTTTNVLSFVDKPPTTVSVVVTTALGIPATTITTLLPVQHFADVSSNNNTKQQQTTTSTTQLGVSIPDKQACQQKEEAIKKEDEVIVPTTTTQVNKEEFTTQHVDEVAKEIINKCSVFEDVEKEEEEDDDIKYATPSEEPESETTQQQTQIINSITSHFQTSKNVEMSNNNVAVPNKSIKPINSNLLDNTTAKDESTITNNYTTTSKPLNNISTSFTLTSNNNKNHTTTITNYLPIMMNKPTTTTAATPTPQRRVYSREFLLSLRNHPQCNRQVDFQSPDMTEIIRRDETGNMGMYSHTIYRAMQQHQLDNMLMFNRFPQYNKRHSQKRDFPSGQQVQRVINVQLDSEVQLHTTDNAWKPTKKKVVGGGDDVDENNTAVESLYKKTRSILNKLTPQNFPTLLQQLKLMNIDTEEKLAGCINLVFEKAISEPKFCEVYAQMANEISVNVKSKNEPKEVLSFRKLLINRCQTQFEKERTDEMEMLEKQKQIDECFVEDDKKLLVLEKEDLLFKARRRSLGNIRFIGELFKMRMLTHKIMFDCWLKLMLADDVDSLECLCWLVKTIGKELDIGANKDQFDANFSEIVRKANSKNVQPRTKFMLQDLLDLRKNKWVPRRKDNNPKTIEQIHQEAQKEEQEKQLQMTTSFPPQQPPIPKNNRQILHRGSDSAADEWNTSGRNNMRNLSRTPIDHSKLKIHRWADTNFKLEPSRANWTAGSNNNSAPNIQTMNCNSRNSSMESEKSTSNRFSGDQRDSYGGAYNRHNKNHTSSIPSHKSEYNDYNSLPHRRNGRESLERKKRSPRPSPSTSRESSSNRDSRHNKSHNYSSASLQKKQQFQKHQHFSYPQFKVPQSSMDTPPRSHPLMGPPESKHSINRPPLIPVNSSQFRNKVVGILDECLKNNFEEAMLCYDELNLTNDAKSHFITTFIGYVIEKQAAHRSACSRLLAELLRRKQLDLSSFQSSLSQLVNDSFDLEIDVPHIWENLSDVISDVMRHYSVNTLGVLSSVVHDRKDERQNASVVKLVLSCLLKSLPFYGQDRLLRGCAESGMSFRHMINILQCPSYAKFNSLYKCESLKPLTCDMLQQTLTKPPTLAPWIEEHKQLFTDANILSRSLMTAVGMAAIKSNQDGSSSLDENEMSRHVGLLKRHLSPDVALDALQELDHALEHPSNLLNSFFQMLHECEVFNKDDFIKWSQTTPNKVGKGIALTSTEQFLSHLRES